MLSSRVRLVALSAAAVLAVAAVVGWDPTGLTEGPGASEAVVRVDQVGYAAGAAKIAVVTGPDDALADAGFAVIDGQGHSVLTGRVGPRTGSWNRRFTSVHTVDLSALTAPGTYRLTLTGTAAGTSPRFRVAPARELMASLVEQNVRFFQAQRDGAEVVAEVLRRKPSHLSDRRATVYVTPRFSADGSRLQDRRLIPAGGPVDASGGWFDAGDFLKFTHTASYAVVQLFLAEREMPAASGLSAEAEYGVRWLDRMWDGTSGTLYGQVGLGAGNDDIGNDHDLWRLPEADDALRTAPGDTDYLIRHRPVFRANEPGAPISPNLAGRVVAAFALAAQADSDPASARRWLDKAAAVYARADTTPTGQLVTAYPAAFYSEESWQDDLELGAAELARAARALGDAARAAEWQRQAGAWARAYLASDAKDSLGVGDVSALAHAELLDSPDHGGRLADGLKADLRRQLADATDRARDDPFGAGAVYTDFDAVPRTFGLVTTALLYARLTGEHQYDVFAVRQRGWALGANPWGSSFVIGVGEVFPHCPEHPVANLAGSLDGTGEILRGAVVNGPNGADKFKEDGFMRGMRPCEADPGRPWSDFDGHGARYVDRVGAWQTVEPALDFTSTALLAFALSGSGPGQR
ncbi:glycoside hydrolase family 9 protein [Streptomyces caeruleatus]|uniref:glycoside hydrolase family 9 protein n=1 Tax=Streptomyces caeruleatus TaxID=661399 RepID=UPI001FC8F064|nr:glycoside hydrolase family 9 protein [Streptomyces caeruleatus]